MRGCLLLAGLGLLALGCDDEAASGDQDGGLSAAVDGGGAPSDGGVPGDSGEVGDGGEAGDGGAEPPVEPPPVVSVTCPPPNADDQVTVTLDGPGRWRLEGCSENVVKLRFTVPPRTAFRLEATSGPGADQPAYAHPPGAVNDTDAPDERGGEVYLHDEPTPVVTLRWVDCWGIDNCGAGRYCAPSTNTCFDCADGDEVFDTRAMGAPRTDAAPRAIDGAAIEGAVCAGFDDWYVLNQAAGQAVSLQAGPTAPPRAFANPRMLHAYLADPAAARLSDLVSVPFDDGISLAAPAVDRTILLRASTAWRPRPPPPPEEGEDGEDGEDEEPAPPEKQAYRFEVGGCATSYDCLPWSYCEAPAPEEPAACMQCAGEQDATGDDGTEAAPVRLEVGVLVEGSICSVDNDWYALTVAEPAVQVTVTGTAGLYAWDNTHSPNTWLGRLGSGDRVYRRGGRDIPDVVVLTIQASGDAGDGATLPYTIQTEVLEACDFDVDPPTCPAGRVCLGRVCVAGVEMVDPCEQACGTLADCAAGGDLCPGIGAADRDGIYEGCLAQCARFPAVATTVNTFEMCFEVVDFAREIDSAFGDRCDGPG